MVPDPDWVLEETAQGLVVAELGLVKDLVWLSHHHHRHRNLAM
jgi:hypothetical protein